MGIPQAIKKSASWYLKNCPGSVIVHLGKYHGDETYYVQMPEESITGYPPVFLFKDGKAVEIMGEESLKVISSLTEG